MRMAHCPRRMDVPGKRAIGSSLMRAPAQAIAWSQRRKWHIAELGITGSGQP
jgi:hypothetical protein